MPKRKRKRKDKPHALCRFKVGDRVRVKQGFMDVEYPDIPLGGWAGVILEVLPGRMYTVRWSRETLTSIHPIYKRRCDRDGLALGEYWLGDDDLEPDPGGPLSIQQPTQIRPRPLSTRHQHDRVRMVFGLTSDDFVPDADEQTLVTYREHLSKRLSLPFWATHAYGDREADASRLKVVALVKDEPPDEDEGILCEVLDGDQRRELPLAELDLRFADRNRRLVDDYCRWFSGELADDVDEDGEEEDFHGEQEDEYADVSVVLKEARGRSAALLVLEAVAFAASFGAVVGSVVVVMPWARWAACIGGAWGLLVAVAESRFVRKDTPLIVRRLRNTLGAVVGFLTGAVHGALFGIMAVAFIGAVLGGVTGLVLRRLVRGKTWLLLRVFPTGVLFPAACGAAAQAFYLDRGRAAEGLWYGALIGLAAGLLVCLLLFSLARFVTRRILQ